MNNVGILSKIKEKGIKGILKSLYIRTYYMLSAIIPSMHSSTARTIWKLFQLLPINKNLILFESEPDFCDNSWALYQYLKKERPHCHLVWIVKNPHDFKNKKDKCTSFVTRYGNGIHLKTIYYYATAKYNFYTHCTFVPYVLRKGQTVINLCHGTVLKGYKGGGENYFDWLMTTSEFAINSQSIFVGCDARKVLPLGSPRNDILTQNISQGIENPFCPKDDSIKKVILWMPTFRASENSTISEKSMDTETGLPLIETVKELEVLNTKLTGLKVVIIAKIHHLQASKVVFKKRYSNIVFVTDDQISEKGLQLYQMVGKSDALISDYSSIMVDYLIVNKPMGFILDDYDKYASSRGFTFDNLKEDILKGEHIYTKGQFLQFIMNVMEGKDIYKEERAVLKKKFHDIEDGMNCKTIVDYFKI